MERQRRIGTRARGHVLGHGGVPHHTWLGGGTPSGPEASRPRSTTGDYIRSSGKRGPVSSGPLIYYVLYLGLPHLLNGGLC